MNAVHRCIEQQAASRGTTPALVTDSGVLSYRDLNARANAVARHLVARGLRRGGRVTVSMAPSANLVVTLLGVLKAGGLYLWQPGSSAIPALAIAVASDGDEDRYLAIEPQAMLAEPVAGSPNLPIVVRDTDTACICPSLSGTLVHVPHVSITALRASVGGGDVRWSHAEPFDFWVPLMTGATLTLAHEPVRTAA